MIADEPIYSITSKITTTEYVINCRTAYIAQLCDFRGG